MDSVIGDPLTGGLPKEALPSSVGYVGRAATLDPSFALTMARFGMLVVILAGRCAKAAARSLKQGVGSG